MLDIVELKQRLREMRTQLDTLGDALNIQTLQEHAASLEEKTLAADFWSDSGEAQKVMAQLQQLRKKINGHTDLAQRLNDAAELLMLAEEEDDEEAVLETGAELDQLEKDMEAASLATLFSGAYDSANAILSLHAGAGGTEAQDWALMLSRMYTRWGDRGKYTVKILDMLDGEEAGIKSAVILIEGENAYGRLKGENGIHRLVRVSPFDSGGRRHTSFAAVEVMPEIDESFQIDIRETDLKVDTFRASGAGGQHINKTDSAVRITHVPTGVTVSCQNERSQHQNKEVCMRMLRSKLVEIKEREHLEKIEDIKGVQKNIEWGSQIRSYVFMPYTLVKDNRTGCEVGDINAVMDGDIDAFIDAYLRASANGTLQTK